MNRVEQVTGIRPDTLRALEADQAAYLRGPAALDARLEEARYIDIQARYRALLTLYTHRTTQAARTAWADHNAAETADDTNTTRRGGGA